MKKILCLTFAALGFVFTSQAQEVQFGAKAGVNFADLNGDNTSDSDEMRTSFHVGGIAEIKFSEKFSLQPELMFSSQGYKMDFTFDGMQDIAPDGTKGNLTSRLNYINLPVMAKYYIIKGLSLEAGPQLGFLVSAKDEIEFPDNSLEFDVKDDYKKLDFGLNFGLGYKLDNGVFFNGRYNMGLTEIVDYGDVKNGVFQLSAGFMF